jgi:hypothetical protein
LVAVFGLGASILPEAVTGDAVAAFVTYVVTDGLVLALVLIQTTGGDYRRAVTVGEFSRRATLRRWKEATGEAVPPSTPEEASAWLASHADDVTPLPQRLHAEVNAGDLAAARRTVDRLPRETAADRHTHAADAWSLDFLEGRAGDLEPVAQLAAKIEDQLERGEALVVTAMYRASAAAAAGGDWIGPMAAAYPHAAPYVDDNEWRIPLVVRVWVMNMLAVSVIAGLALLVWRALGTWG